MQSQIKILISLLIFIGAANAAGEETKYLCISEDAGGLIYKSGSWQATSFEVGAKYLMVMESGALKSVKGFGEPDDLAMTYCSALEPTKSLACSSNFDMFRYQPSTKRFVMAKTSGFTNEFEEISSKLSATFFTPNISLGYCESL
jgi:hypothetical protein